MKIIKQYFEYPFGEPDGEKILRDIELAGRVCYKTEEKIGPETHYEFVRKALAKKHFSIIEHPVVTVRSVTNRGVTHEIVRHRIASYSQESTRYCDYCLGKFGGELTYILPLWFYDEYNNASNSAYISDEYGIWLNAIAESETNYRILRIKGQAPEKARGILPSDLKTEIIMTYNMREWRHFFRLRTAPAAHPQMRELATMIHDDFKKKIPVLFDSVDEE